MNRSIKKQNKTSLLADKTKKRKKRKQTSPSPSWKRKSLLFSRLTGSACLFLRAPICFFFALPSLPSIEIQPFIILECGFSCCCFPWVIGERQREKETFGCCCAITRLHSATKGPRKKGFEFLDGRNEVPVTICTHYAIPCRAYHSGEMGEFSFSLARGKK